MTDERLRELERRFRETGSVEDEAALLKERVRAGDLDRDELELAAYLLNEAALAAIGEDAWIELSSAAKRKVPGSGKSKSSADDLAVWIQGLDHWDPELSLRVAIAVGAAILEEVLGMEQPGFQSPAGVIDICRGAQHASEAWLVDQSEAGLEAVRGFWNQGPMPPMKPWQLAVLRVPRAIVSMFDSVSDFQRESGATVARRAHELIGNSFSIHDESLGLSQTDEKAYQRLKAIIRDEVSPWVLGAPDPVRARVEARASS